MRCEYEHDEFKRNNAFAPYEASSYTSDGTRQCYMQEDDVAEFNLKDSPKTIRCMFHPPKDKEWESTKWNKGNIGKAQSNRFIELLRSFQIINDREEKKPSPSLRVLVLAGMNFGEIKQSNLRIYGEIRLTDANFWGDIDWAYAKFKGYARFKNVHFHKEVLFGGVEFMQDSMFNKVYFHNKTRFEGVEFAWNPLLQESIFHDDLYFERCVLERGGRFTKCNFRNLHYTTHTGERLLFNNCSTSDNASFVDQDCSRLSFLNMDISRADFLGADVSLTRFEACRWEKQKPDYAVVCQHDQHLARQIDDETKSKETSDKYRDRLLKLKSTYRQLMKNLDDSRDHKQAGDFHYRDMELREKLLSLEENPIPPDSLFELPMLKLYRRLADYGESYMWLLFWLLASVPIASVMVAICEHVKNSQQVRSAVNCFYEIPWLSGFTEAFKKVLLGIIPSPFQKEVARQVFQQDAESLWFVSKGVILLETIVALILATLFVMAVNRRFRR